MRGQFGVQTFGRADVFNQNWSLTWLLHEPSCWLKERELIRAMGTRGRNMQHWRVQGSGGCHCTVAKRDRDGAAPAGPHSFPSPFPSQMIYKLSCSQPCSGSWPMGTCPHLVLAELLPAEDLGRFGEILDQTPQDTQTASHRLSVAQAVGNGFYFPL